MTARPDPTADEARPDEAALAARIEVARRRGFGPLMTLLERALGERAQVGTTASPREEGIRFRHDPALEFNVSDVVSVLARELPPDPEDFTAEPQRIQEVSTTFLGLTGAVSPLPTYLAEEVAQEDPEDPRMREFLDLFHHRILSLLRRAQTRCDFPATFRTGAADAWSRRVLALLGLDLPAGTPTPASAWRLLRYAPLLAERSLTARAIEVALEDALAPALPGVAVQVEQFAGAWVEISPADRTRLGRSSSRLGSDLLLGRRIFDRAGKFRLVLGPLSQEGFQRVTTQPWSLRTVRDTMTALTAQPLDFEVVLLLAPDAAPRLELSARGPCRLGRNTWLGGQLMGARTTVELPV